MKNYGSSVSFYAIFLVAFCFVSSPAHAQGFEVSVSITKVEAKDCLDPGSWIFFCDAADFYPIVRINEDEYSANDIGGDDSITPNWEFKKIVGISNLVDVDVEIWDSDGFLRGDDDHVDITPSGGRQLDFAINPESCQISGEISGSCGDTLTSTGTSNDKAEIRIVVNVRRVSQGEVEVTIERLTALDGMDPGSAADFYSRVGINGAISSNRNSSERERFSNDNDIAPYWQFRRTVLLDDSSIKVDIQTRDADGIWNGDDKVDISPEGRDLNLFVNNAGSSGCTISGEVTGTCGDILDAQSRIHTEGTSNDRASFQVRVDVHVPPRVYVRCIHEPIWPQVGDEVTFRAEVLDANMRPLSADNIRVLQPWGNSPTNIKECKNINSCTLSLNAPDEFAFSYGCEADVEGVLASSQRRISTIGNPTSDRAIPVLVHRSDPVEAIDFVFLPDEDSYTSAEDTTFINDVFTVVRDAYFDYELFLRNQHKINFWIGTDAGQANGFSSDDDAPPCLVLPDDYALNYSFSDAGVVLHTDSLRDCARGRGFSSEPDSIRTVRHETGHRPFGLADEYCCDGGYFNLSPNPNLFGPQAVGGSGAETACLDDPLAELEDSCRSFTSERVDEGSLFFRLDHAPEPDSNGVTNDLMLDNHVPRAADVRRIQAVFDDLP